MQHSQRSGKWEDRIGWRRSRGTTVSATKTTYTITTISPTLTEQEVEDEIGQEEPQKLSTTLIRQYNKGIVAFDHYNYFKNNFSTTLRLDKNNYFQRKFTECSNNLRETWKTLNSLIRCKNTSKDVTLIHNGFSISDPSVIAEVFNNNFSNTASNLDRKLPH